MKREKRIACPWFKVVFFVLSVLLVWMAWDGLCLQVFAENTQKVVDEADLLTESEEEKLQKQLSKIAETYQCDVAVVTMNAIDGTDIQYFTDEYYYENGYGYGDELDGIILLVDMDTRKFHLATRGDAIRIFTDYGLETIDDLITPSLRKGNYYKAFAKFGSLAEDFIKEANSQEPYDVRHTYKEPMAIWLRLLITFGVGLLAAVIVLIGLFAQLKSVGVEKKAQEYIRAGSFRVTRQRDIFLYRNVSRRKIEKNTSGGGRGGSTTHKSAGGGRSGGRTGSF